MRVDEITAHVRITRVIGTAGFSRKPRNDVASAAIRNWLVPSSADALPAISPWRVIAIALLYRTSGALSSADDSEIDATDVQVFNFSIDATDPFVVSDLAYGPAA